MKFTSLVRTLVTAPIVVKAFHTFYQSFLAAWVLTGLSLNRVSLIACVAAAISAVKTLIIATITVKTS